MSANGDKTLEHWLGFDETCEYLTLWKHSILKIGGKILHRKVWVEARIMTFSYLFCKDSFKDFSHNFKNNLIFTAHNSSSIGSDHLFTGRSKLWWCWMRGDLQSCGQSNSHVVMWPWSGCSTMMLRRSVVMQSQFPMFPANSSETKLMGKPAWIWKFLTLLLFLPPTLHSTIVVPPTVHPGSTQDSCAHWLLNGIPMSYINEPLTWLSEPHGILGHMLWPLQRHLRCFLVWWNPWNP